MLGGIELKFSTVELSYSNFGDVGARPEFFGKGEIEIDTQDSMALEVNELESHRNHCDIS